MEYTKKELDMLLFLRKKPHTAQEIIDKVKPGKEPLEALGVMLSRTEKLYYCESGDEKKLSGGLIHLNQRGETVAQAEFDRRFDMYYTRIVSLVALVLSALAIIVTTLAG